MNMKSILAACLSLVLTAVPGMAAAQQEIRLWPGMAPGTSTWQVPEQIDVQERGRRVTNVSDPTLTVYLPPREIANGTAIIVAPGGGMRALSIDSGGTEVARWLNQRGYAAFVLKYRVRQQEAPARSPAATAPMQRPRGGQPPAELPEMGIVNGNADPAQNDPEMARVYQMAIDDAGEAIKLIRANASEWAIDPNKVGIMGFSAGGGVAVGSALRPAGPAYPNFVITLFGPSLMEVNVPEYAAPLFMAVKQDHHNVTPGLLALFTEWRDARRPAELHVYDMINGNLSMEQHNTPSDTWLDRVVDWLAIRSFAPQVAYENVR